MNILVATDRTLDPEKAADAVARLHDDGDGVVVFTAMNFPAEFLVKLGESGIKEASDIALAAGHGVASGAMAAERLSKPRVRQDPPPSDSPVLKALGTSAKHRMASLVDALSARGITAETAWTTTENKTANSIMDHSRSHDIDVIVIGSHGHGRFEGLLGSTGTKLVRLAPASVLRRASEE